MTATDTHQRKLPNKKAKRKEGRGATRATPALAGHSAQLVTVLGLGSEAGVGGDIDTLPILHKRYGRRAHTRTGISS